MDLSKPATKLSVHPQSAPEKNAKPAPLERFPHETQWCDSLWFQLFWADLTPTKTRFRSPLLKRRWKCRVRSVVLLWGIICDWVDHCSCRVDVLLRSKSEAFGEFVCLLQSTESTPACWQGFVCVKALRFHPSTLYQEPTKSHYVWASIGPVVSCFLF